MHQPSEKFLPAAAEMIVSPRKIIISGGGSVVIPFLSLVEQGNKLSKAQPEILSARTEQAAPVPQHILWAAPLAKLWEKATGHACVANIFKYNC